ncbi:Gp37 family protein [Tateyamaria sp.]|uniref:Gp37 family protein n=1 Tax=Tateyamaria sp. TaxID=1929288 RepID=UPI003B20D70C
MSDQQPILRKTHLEKIEDGIVEALKQGGLSAKYLIDAFPDNPDQFDMDDLEKVALVQYTGSRYDAPGETGSAAQMRRAEYAIHLYLRRVSTPVRGMREIEQLRLAVQGLSLEGTELMITRDGLVDQDAALWRYVIEVACWIPAVPLTRTRPSPFITDFNKPEGA